MAVEDAVKRERAKQLAAQPVPDELVEAVEAVIDRWDTPAWKDVGPTADVIGRLRAARDLPRKTEAEIRADEREHLMSLALGSEADEYRAYDGHVAEWLRSQTQGEE